MFAKNLTNLLLQLASQRENHPLRPVEQATVMTSSWMPTMPETHSQPPAGPNRFDLAAQLAAYAQRFAQQLESQPLWHILPVGVTDLSQATGIFDSRSQLIYPAATALQSFLKKHPFTHLRALQSQQNLATLDSVTRLLWNNEASDQPHTLAESQTITQNARWAKLSGWLLPEKEQLYDFACAAGNPYRQGRRYRLKNFEGNEHYGWMTRQGHCDVDSDCWGFSSGSGYIFACHPLWHSAGPEQILATLAIQQWRLVAPDGSTFAPPQADARWQGQSSEALLFTLQQNKLHLLSAAADGKTPSQLLRAEDFLPGPLYADLDFVPCRLPQLDDAQLCDPEKGLWELWGQDAALLKKLNLVARDPGRDVQRRAVAIDFGTSSTVVAMDDPSGKRLLLRIGVRDYYEPPKPQHFENPTVLECLDYRAFHAAWSAEAYRPALNWEWMRAAHEAQANFRDNPGDTQVMASILPRLKQWALRSDADRRVRLTDRQGHEIEIPQHTERNPVRGQALQSPVHEPFDPVELYAWYLGMVINGRTPDRGLFLKYYLSFPVKYPLEVKNRILASFRLGLQRSLPQSLITHHPEVLHEFEVTDLASEPAAYAAAALPHLGIEPTETGVPYAVFDFGGGTSDFDFGLLRWANEAEEAEGYERVFEHLASDGDNMLGGENLLEHLVYACFQHNLDILRRERIQFTQPLKASGFSGSEAFLSATQAAQTNTVMLAAKLRPFMEGAKAELPEQIKLDLIDANGNKKPCELALNASALDALLLEKIREGVHAFLVVLRSVLPDLPEGVSIQVLLAGNGCRSRHIQALFDTEGESWGQLQQEVFGDLQPTLVIHAPLPMDDHNHHAPTAKTGVALGLLRVAPGANVKLVNHVHTRHDGQAPFAHFVGRLWRGKFEPRLVPGVTYRQWHEIGMLQQGVFNLLTTASPRARTGLVEGDAELSRQRLDFPAAPPGAKLYARAIKPDVLELAAALDQAGLEDGPAIQLNLH